MSKLQRTLIADVFDAAFYQGDRLAFVSDTLTDAGIDVKVNEKEVRGGKGNGLIATLHSSRDITVKLTDPVFRFETLAMQLGTDIVTGEGIGYCMIRYYPVKVESAKKQITLEKLPLKATDVELFHKGEKLKAEDYVITDSVVEFKSDKVKELDKITVYPYAYRTNASARLIEINSDTFATGGKLVLETIEINEKEIPTARLFYVFENALPTGNFSINSKSEKDASPVELELKIAKPADSSKVGYILREDIDTPSK